MAASGMPVEFARADQGLLRGRVYGAGRGWAVLVHDENQDSRAWSGLTSDLRGEGLRVLLFDLSGHGASDGPRSARRTPGDISAALRFALSRGARHLYLIAAGASASAALVAASRFPAIRALVALSPTSIGSPSRLSETTAPKLIVVGSLDDQAARDADVVFRRSVGWVVVTSPPVHVQGTDLLASVWGDDIRQSILGFLRDYVVTRPTSGRGSRRAGRATGDRH
jgi:pimeloyl-ACP methyl ester carboxylesterase